MAEMENLKFNETGEIRYENKATDNITHAKKENVQQAVKSSTENQEDSTETKELKKDINDILQIPGDKKDYLDCFNLIIGKETLETIKGKSSVKKAQIAWELACLMLVNDEKLSEIQEKLDSGTDITPENLGVGSWTDLQELFDKAQNLMKNKMYELFRFFGGAGVMPDVKSLATGDGSSTSGIKGKANIGRLFFDYPKLDESNNFTDKLKMSSNNFKFKDRTQDAKIIISATGFDKHDGIGGGSIKFIFTKEGEKTKFISRDYSIQRGGDKPYLLRNNPDSTMPKEGNAEVTVTKNALHPELYIPKEFADWNIKVETFSNKYKKGGYDEINFNIISENGEITRNIETYAAFERGSYKLTEEATAELKDLAGKIDWYDEEHWPHKLEITNDCNGYYLEENTAKAKLKKFEDDEKSLYNQIVNVVGTDCEEKIKILKENIGNDINKKVDEATWINSSGRAQKMTETNKAIQKQLAMNRFLSSFIVLLSNNQFKNKFLEINDINKFLRAKFNVIADKKTISIE